MSEAIPAPAPIPDGRSVAELAYGEFGIEIVDPTPALRPLRAVTGDGRDADEAAWAATPAPTASEREAEQAATLRSTERKREVTGVVLTTMGVLAGSGAALTVSIGLALAVLGTLTLALGLLVILT